MTTKDCLVCQLTERVKELEGALREALNTEQGELHTSDSCWPWDFDCSCRVSAWKAVLDA